MNDQKELKKKKCSTRGCKSKAEAVFETKEHCKIHYDNINPRIKRFRFPRGSVY